MRDQGVEEAQARADRQWLVVLRARPALFAELLAELPQTQRETVAARVRRATEAERAAHARRIAR